MTSFVQGENKEFKKKPSVHFPVVTILGVYVRSTQGPNLTKSNNLVLRPIWICAIIVFPRDFFKGLDMPKFNQPNMLNPHCSTNSHITIMSIVHMEEHFILVIRNNSVVKLTFHLIPLVQNYQIPWIPHILPMLH
jgi:hypothetical protein